MHGEDAYFSYLEADPEVRPFIAARSLLTDELMRAVADAIGDKVPYSSRLVARIGKRAAGRRLDGREHNEMPEVRL